MGGQPAKKSVAPCKKKLFNARWHNPEVKCGDPAKMLADGENLTTGATATFTVMKSDGGKVAGSTGAASSSAVSGDWVSKKSSADWPPTGAAGQLQFRVTADGLTTDSVDPRLSFHKYADVPQVLLTKSLHSPVPPAPAKYGWKERVLVELKDRKLILTVRVHLKNRAAARPEQGKKESYSDYYARCEKVAIGGPIPDSSKNTIKSAVEDVYRDRWFAHRKNCGRHSSCDCDRSFKCCKFEIEVKLELLDAGGTSATAVNLWPGAARADSGNWYRGESRPGKSWAHEVGHLMGFYDEYPSGAIGAAPWQPDAPASIMGDGKTIMVYHLEEFRAWLSGQISEDVELVRI